MDESVRLTSRLGTPSSIKAASSAASRTSPPSRLATMASPAGLWPLQREGHIDSSVLRVTGT